MTNFEPRRAMLKGPDLFQRLVLDGAPRRLSGLHWNGERELLIFERGGRRFGFDAHEFGYHHVGQGEIAGVPVMIAFCGICHSGRGFDPVVEGRELKFSAGGLYDGIVLLTDDETGSYWNHMTGECVYGELLGKRLDSFDVELTTVAGEMARAQDPEIYAGRVPCFGRFMAWMQRRGITDAKGFMPFFFKRTMTVVDTRAGKMEQGLGVLVGDQAHFYPLAALAEPISDQVGGLAVTVRVRREDGMPEALAQGGRRPTQIFCRWYGFSATFPDCEVVREG